MSQPRLIRPLHCGPLLVALALSLGALACDSTATLVNAPSFDRPESLSFVCFDLSDPDVPLIAPLSACQPPDINVGEDDPGDPIEPFALHSLVSQTTTGEVAIVRMTGDTQGVIDSDVRVPGFTFVSVGEVPSAVVTPESNPEYTYIITRGSSEVTRVATLGFRSGLGADVERFDVLPEGSRPSAMLLSPDESTLYVALPQTGQIASIRLEDSGPVAGDLLDLSTDIPSPVDLRSLDSAQLPPDYAYLCNVQVIDPSMPAPRTPISEGVLPRPWDLELDTVDGRLLVADRNLPLIHVLDLESFTELPPLSVSVPTRDVSLTPFVPATLDSTDALERYVYAIDEIDGSVLAVDYGQPTRGSFGAVLPVNVRKGGATDRLDLLFPARTLAVVSPDYQDSATATLCENSEFVSPIRLRGVFLATGAADGRVRFFDIHDLDARCRGDEACAFGDAANSNDVHVSIRRHRPRLGNFVEEQVGLGSSLTWTVGGASIEVDGEGRSTDSGLAPDLVNVECPEGLGAVLSSESGALVCAVTDPWAAASDAFSITYSGVLPFTQNTGGNLEAGSDSLQTRAAPCELGVLGSQDVPSSGDLASYGGDMLAITSALPPSTTEDARCIELVQRDASGETVPVLLPILSAATDPEGLLDTYRGRLTLGAPTLEGFTFEDVRRCFVELLEYEIRAGDAFVVRSERDGFRHPVVRGTDGQCQVDEARVLAEMQGRVNFSHSFRSPSVAFALGARPADLDTLEMRFSTDHIPPTLSVDVSVSGSSNGSSLLTTLRYNAIDQRLYAIDQSRRGLLRLRLSLLGVQSAYR